MVDRWQKTPTSAKNRTKVKSELERLLPREGLQDSTKGFVKVFSADDPAQGPAGYARRGKGFYPWDHPWD
jgi:hypothetical protein